MIAIGCNCSGYKLKEETKRFFEENAIEYKDFGTYKEEVLDDPEAVKDVCKTVQDGKVEYRSFNFRKRIWYVNDSK